MTATDALFWATAWIGHAAIWVAPLNRLYGRALPKSFLKPYRYATGALILAFPLLGLVPGNAVLDGYLWVCVGVAVIALPVVTVARWAAARRGMRGVTREVTTRDLWTELGPDVIGDGRMRWATRLPRTDVFRVELTRLTLPLDGLPAALDGIEIVLLSDLHFHGTPARPFFETVLDALAAEPPPDLVLLAGDYVDSNDHRAWIVPLLSRLRATAGRFAVLGNHDAHHSPDAVRAELRAAGYTVLGGDTPTATVTICGEPVTIVGDESPWFAGPQTTDGDGFKILLAHTPDRFPWAAAHGFGLVVAGHVHGGQIRVPLYGSIFVPSVHGRRFDAGLFRLGRTALVVSRGLSGKEPLRFRCRPEVIRVRLAAGAVAE